MNEMVKIGPVEYRRSEVERFYRQGLYVAAYSGVWSIRYSEAQQGFYGHKVLDVKNLAGRGRHYLLTAGQINRILGQEVLREATA